VNDELTRSKVVLFYFSKSEKNEGQKVDVGERQDYKYEG